MDAPASWREVIEGILIEETRVPVSYGEVTLYTVFDREQDHYLLMAVGWDGRKRVHAPLIHVDIIAGKDSTRWNRTRGGSGSGKGGYSQGPHRARISAHQSPAVW